VNTYNNAELRHAKDFKFVPSRGSTDPASRRLVWNENLEIEPSSMDARLNGLLKPILKMPHTATSRRPSQQGPPMFGSPPPPASPAPNSARPSSPFRGSSPRISDLLGFSASASNSDVGSMRPPSPAPQRPQPIRQLISSIKGGPVRAMALATTPQRPFSAQPQFQMPSNSYASQLPSRAVRGNSPVVSSVRPPFSSTRPPTPPIHRENLQIPSPGSFKAPLIPTLRPRTATGIIRRAPSPTPAFNKWPMSSAAEKQRWRT
jgi:hypothetical protein